MPCVKKEKKVVAKKVVVGFPELTEKFVGRMARKKLEVKDLAKLTKLTAVKLNAHFKENFKNVTLAELVAIHKALGYKTLRFNF